MDKCAPLGAGVRHPRVLPVHGRAVQVDPIRPVLKVPGTGRLKLKRDTLLSNYAFNFNLRRYTMLFRFIRVIKLWNFFRMKVGPCSFTP